MKYVKIKIKKDTERKIAKLGSISENYDIVISDLLKHVNTCDRFWENRFE